MTAPRVRCAAAGLYQDRHQAVERWWTLTSPSGDEIVLCSAACVLEWIVYRDWTADLAPGALMQAGNPHGDGEVAA